MNVETTKSELKIKLMDDEGNSQTLTVPDPNEELTDTEFYAGAKGMLEADALRPFGNQFVKISELKLVDTTRTDFDIAALKAN